MAVGLGAPFLSGGAADPRLLGVQDYLSLIQSLNPAGRTGALQRGDPFSDSGFGPPPQYSGNPAARFGPGGADPGFYQGSWDQPQSGMAVGAPGIPGLGVGVPPRHPNAVPAPRPNLTPDENQLLYKGGNPPYPSPDHDWTMGDGPGGRNRGQFFNFLPPSPDWTMGGGRDLTGVPGRQPYGLNGMQAQKLDRLPPRYWEMVRAGMSPDEAIRRGEAFKAGQLPGQQPQSDVVFGPQPGGPSAGPRQPSSSIGIGFPGGPTVGPPPGQAGMAFNPGGIPGLGVGVAPRYPNAVPAPRPNLTPDPQLSYKRGVPYGNDMVARQVPPAPRQKLPQEPNVKPPQRDVRAPRQPRPMIADEPPLNQPPTRRPQRPLVGGGRWSQYR